MPDSVAAVTAVIDRIRRLQDEIVDAERVLDASIRGTTIDPLDMPIRSITDGWALNEPRGALYLFVKMPDNVIRTVTLNDLATPRNRQLLRRIVGL